MMKIILASTSPRRKQLLEQIDIDFELANIDIDETWNQDEAPEAYVKRMALEKAQAAKASLQTTLPILAADTSVVLDDIILGKAENNEDAKAMLTRLSGKEHIVYTAVALITDVEQVNLNTNKVSFRSLSDQEIQEYCDTGEPLGKAGAYAIQGKAAAFIEKMEGSYSGVMGLPLFEVSEMLKSVE